MRLFRTVAWVFSIGARCTFRLLTKNHNLGKYQPK
jgi:hypothetical protein